MGRHRAFLVVMIMLLVIPFTNVYAYVANVVIAEDYDTFVEDTRTGNMLDICRHVPSTESQHLKTLVHVEKKEPTGPPDDPRDPQIVLSSLSPAVCHVENDNLLHQGTCKIFTTPTRYSSAEYSAFVYTNTYEDFCLSQTTVAECFVAVTPFDVVGTSEYFTEKSQGILDHVFLRPEYKWDTSIIRYAYTQCPDGMVCSGGRCTTTPPESGTEEHKERQRLLPSVTGSTIASMMKTPNTQMYRISGFPGRQAKKVEHYPLGSDMVPMFIDTADFTIWGAGILSAYGLGQMPLNLMAGGKCTLRTRDVNDLNAEGTVVDEAFDKCVMGQIQECYISYARDAVNGEIQFESFRCPEGTVCQYHRDGSRCDVPSERRDMDGDGVSQEAGDCNDNPDEGGASMYPGAPDNQCRAGEEGQGIDNDCDGIIDDACEADESSATCKTRDLTYEGTAPGGKCCGDDPDETWNLFTSSASATNGCFQSATIPVNEANLANLAAGEWTRDREGTDVIGTAGMYPRNDELELSSSWAYAYIPARQFHGKRMVWEFEYKEGPRSANMLVSIDEVQNDDRSSTSRIQDTVIYQSGGWSKIRREFDYDAGTAADASGLRIGILKRTLDATPKIRNFRVYPKDVEKVIYVDNQAYGCQAEESLIATQRYNTPAIPSSGVAIPAANMKNRCDVVTSSSGQSFVCDNDGFWKGTPDGTTQLRSIGDEVLSAEICFSPPCPSPPPPPEPDYEIISKKQGCCGGNSCWDGMGCTPERDAILTGDTRSLCVAGEWQTEVLKKDQYNQLSPTRACGGQQCFWNNGPLGASGGEDECVNNEEFKEDYQCFFGSWRTRTSMLAQQMLQMTGTGTRPDKYTFFCDEPGRVALADVFGGAYQNVIFGDESGNCGVDSDVSIDGQAPCVNNVCVLKFWQGGEEKVAVGMSLNKDIDAPFTDPGESILRLIPEAAPYAGEGYYSYCDGVIDRSSSGWVYYSCNGPDSAIEGSPAKLWYNPKTKSIIYSPQGVVVGRETPGTRFLNALLNPFDTMFGVIRGLLGLAETEGVASDREVVAKKIKFDRIYIQRDGRQAIRGILQRDDDEPNRDLMAVEYENIPLDVCANLNRIACTDGTDCSCEPTFIQKGSITSFTPDAWGFMIKVKGAAGLEFADKWDDLTAKTRLDPSVRASGPASDAPSIGFMTPTSTEALTRFLIREVPDEEDIIGYYWMFETRDDKIIGKGARTHEDASNIEHTFPANGTYDVYLNVINKNFAVERAQTTVTIPSSGGGLSVEELSRLIDESDRARLCAELGICFSVTLPAPGGP